jgi:hypothetical protein
VWQANAMLATVMATDTIAARFVRVSSDIALALLVLVVAARALRIDEFTEALAIVRRGALGPQP